MSDSAADDATEVPSPEEEGKEGVVGATPPLHVLLAEDDEAVSGGIVEALATFFAKRLKVFDYVSADGIVQVLEEGGTFFDIALVDQHLLDGAPPIEAIVEHLMTRRRAGLVQMSGYGALPPLPNLPESIAQRSLHKPFGLRALRAAVQEMIDFIEAGTAVADEEEEEDTQSFFNGPLSRFETFSDLMRELPHHPEHILPDALEGLSAFAPLIAQGLNAMVEELDRSPSMEAFGEFCSGLFPIKKRRSLLRLLASVPEAGFALDIAWHDVNNALIDRNDLHWQAARERIHRILNPALAAFSLYSTSHDRSVFLEEVPFELTGIRRGYALVDSDVTDYVDRAQLPVGGMGSIFETFTSNARKVAEGSPYLLNLRMRVHREGDLPFVEVIVADDLPGFDADRLKGLFDGRIQSAAAGGMGTGLERLWHIVEAAWAGRTVASASSFAPDVPMALFQRNGEDWILKVPGEEPCIFSREAMNAFPGFQPDEKVTKFFRFLLPLAEQSQPVLDR